MVKNSNSHEVEFFFLFGEMDSFLVWSAPENFRYQLIRRKPESAGKVSRD